MIISQVIAFGNMMEVKTMVKDLKYLRKELVFSRKLTDEALSFFRDIDVMNSTGMMTWLVDTCSEAITHSNETIEYNGKNLDEKAFVALLSENLSSFLVDRIKEKAELE